MSHLGSAGTTSLWAPQPQQSASAQAQRRLTSMTRFLQAFHAGEPFEIRALKVGRRGTVSGIFTDLRQAAYAVANALEYSGARGVYVTLNALRPEAVERFPHRLINNAQRTICDKDILRRRWLLLDFDPERPTGVSATDAEAANAIERAQDARVWLTQRGWPTPLVVASGNGAHLLYRVDLPNDAESRELICSLLYSLAQRFTDQVVALDTTTANAARLTKLVGTLARKGMATSERPHRRAELVSAPDLVSVVAQALLEEAAALTVSRLVPALQRNSQVAGAEAARSIHIADVHIADAAPWLAAHGVRFRERPPHDDARRFELERCLWADHADPWKAWVVQRADGHLFAGCHAEKCAGRSFTDLRAVLEPATPSASSPYVPHMSAVDARADGAAQGAHDADALVSPSSWPQLNPAALHGLVGDIVQLIEPHTEADPVALLVQLLVYFGNTIGRSAWVRIEAQRHYGNECAVLVGDTAKARKGTSAGWVESAYTTNYPALEEWRIFHLASGLTSGEGLIHAIRDLEQDVNATVFADHERALMTDKRLLARESEFGSTLRIMGREGNSLSASYATRGMGARYEPWASVRLRSRPTRTFQSLAM